MNENLFFYLRLSTELIKKIAIDEKQGNITDMIKGYNIWGIRYHNFGKHITSIISCIDAWLL